MQFHLFQYPLPYDGNLNDLNSFLSNHRVVSVNREVVNCNGNQILLFTVETISGEVQESVKSRQRVDYREQLSEDQYALFNLLRDERKRLADNDAIPEFRSNGAEAIVQGAATNQSTTAARIHVVT